MSGLGFSKFRLRSISSLIIPEIMSAQGKVHKPFNTTRLLEKAEKLQPPDECFQEFKNPRPISDLKKQRFSTRYQEKFWSLFWGQTFDHLPMHFPFELEYKYSFSRPVDCDGLDSFHSSQSKSKIASQGAYVIARLYPYGAVSIQVNELLLFTDTVTCAQIVDFIENQPVLANGKAMTLRQFFEQTWNGIIEQTVDKFGPFPPQSRLSYYVINPEVETLPDLSGTWHDVASLLAMSTLERHISKYDQSVYSKNHGKDDQRILVSPFSCIVLAPHNTFRKPKDGPGCLRDRISNIAELVMIQEGVINQYDAEYKRMAQSIEYKMGRPIGELKSFVKDRLGHFGDELNAVRTILGFHKLLESRPNNRWFDWYSAILRERVNSATVQDFTAILEELSKKQIELGRDVRESIKSVIATLGDLANLVSSVTGK